MKRILLSFIIVLLFTPNANAASRFWVGGTGTWDASDTTHWSASSGGAGGQTVPGSADSATFDASSGGGTVTVNTTVTITTLVTGAFTGTLDFSANNNNVTLSAAGSAFNGSGTGVRTINLGNGIWTITGSNWDLSTITNLTFNANSSTIVFTGAQGHTLTMGNGKSYSTVTLNANTQGGIAFSGGNPMTIAQLNIIGPNVVRFNQSTTHTITNLTTTTSSSAPIFLRSVLNPGFGTATISSPNALAVAWANISNLTFTGAGSFTATNSLNQGLNVNMTIGSPSGSGGSCILGGWLLWRDLPEHINDNFPAWLEKAG